MISFLLPTSRRSDLVLGLFRLVCVGIFFLFSMLRPFTIPVRKRGGTKRIEVVACARTTQEPFLNGPFQAAKGRGLAAGSK